MIFDFSLPQWDSLFWYMLGAGAVFFAVSHAVWHMRIFRNRVDLGTKKAISKDDLSNSEWILAYTLLFVGMSVLFILGSFQNQFFMGISSTLIGFLTIFFVLAIPLKELENYRLKNRFMKLFFYKRIYDILFSPIFLFFWFLLCVFVIFMVDVFIL